MIRLCACGTPVVAVVTVYGGVGIEPLFKRSYCNQHASYVAKDAHARGFEVHITAAQ